MVCEEVGVEQGEGREVDRDGNPEKNTSEEMTNYTVRIYTRLCKEVYSYTVCTCTPSESISATATHSVGSNARDQECCDETEHLKSVSIIEHLKLSTRYHTSQCTLQQKLHYSIMLNLANKSTLEGIDSRLGQK